MHQPLILSLTIFITSCSTIYFDRELPKLEKDKVSKSQKSITLRVIKTNQKSKFDSEKQFLGRVPSYEKYLKNSGKFSRVEISTDSSYSFKNQPEFETDYFVDIVIEVPPGHPDVFRFLSGSILSMLSLGVFPAFHYSEEKVKVIIYGKTGKLAESDLEEDYSIASSILFQLIPKSEPLFKTKLNQVDRNMMNHVIWSIQSQIKQ